ncbi:MAG: transposase [Candidatus Omnitrophica bacterium]|jgi:putative transposase|nr:transposase [Candidatus Omnitrophota bacterium]MDD5079174.1 transposase [Candidatus Omnitrophota bacterium]
MPAYARKHQLSNAVIYHVFNRSLNKKVIFGAPNDYFHFRRLLRDYCRKFKLSLYHWAIMPTHYHLLLEIDNPAQISRFMAGLNRAYTHYHHKVYSSSGFLWGGRFKSQAIQKERYLVACGRYIERNPVRAEFVNNAQDYLHSSAGFYCTGAADELTTEDTFYTELGNDPETKRIAYTEFLRDFNADEEELFANLEDPLGDINFITRLRKQNGRFMPRNEGRPQKHLFVNAYTGSS